MPVNLNIINGLLRIARTEEDSTGKNWLSGLGKVTKNDKIWPQWVVGGIERDVDNNTNLDSGDGNTETGGDDNTNLGTGSDPNPQIISNDDDENEDLQPSYIQGYLAFEALENGTFSFANTTNTVNNIAQYSLDNGVTWTNLAAKTNTPVVEAGNKILWKGPLTVSGDYGMVTFSSTGQFNIEGNIMSLLYGDDFEDKTDIIRGAFWGLLMNCTKLISAENLVLPALTLAPYCYSNTFHGCTSLTTAPELPATKIEEGSYKAMFYGCTNLNYIKCLATNINAASCTNYWVSEVSSTGTFVKAASMTDWTRGANGIPNGWTIVNNE